MAELDPLATMSLPRCTRTFSLLTPRLHTMTLDVLHIASPQRLQSSGQVMLGGRMSWSHTVDDNTLSRFYQMYVNLIHALHYVLIHQ
jgi:hypothetical protein